MANHPHRRLTARNLLGVLLTLVGVWAVVATSQDDPRISSPQVEGSIDIAAGETAQLVFDLAATGDALVGGRVPEFRIQLSELTDLGAGGQITSSIVGYTEPTVTISPYWELGCSCVDGEVVLEFELPADSPQPFATIEWIAFADIFLDEDDSDAGTLELTLAESNGAAVVEIASGSLTGGVFSVEALDVELDGDEQLWIQSLGYYDDAAVIIAPDGHRFEMYSAASLSLECSTGPCSGRFLLAAPVTPQASALTWRVVSLSEGPAVISLPVEMSSAAEEIIDLEDISLDSQEGAAYALSIDLADLETSVLDPYIHLEVGFTGGDAQHVNVRSATRGYLNNDELGFFVPHSGTSATETVDLTVVNTGGSSADGGLYIKVTLYWLPTDSSANPQLSITAERS